MANDLIAACEPRVTLILGREKTGKTERLVSEAARLVDEGVAAQDLLVFAATPDTARILQRRLAKARPQLAATQVRVVRAFALDLLSSPQACAFTGRNPRVLARFEESFLAEDLKVSGMKPKRIGDMLRFFCRSWTELADMQEDWLIYKEQQELHDLVKQTLSSYKAYMATEVSNAACAYMAYDLQAHARACAAHVLVDDYQNLSRASQQLVRSLATETLTVAANPTVCIEAFESYPYLKGIEELQRDFKDVSVITLDDAALPKGVLTALRRLSALSEAEPLGRQEGDVRAFGVDIIACDDPARECTAVCDWVQAALKDAVLPGDIAVVVPNRTWERNMARALEETGVPTARASEIGDIGGDVRYLDLSQAAQFITLLTLAADPADAPALRAWCGFGDYLTCRSLFSELFSQCCREGIGLADALKRIRASMNGASLEASGAITFMNDARTVTGRLDELAAILDAVQGLQGEHLIEALARVVAPDLDGRPPAALVKLLCVVEPCDTAESLCKKVREAMLYPILPQEDAVAVLEPQRCAGLDASQVALVGMVNGLVPAHAAFDRTKTSPQKATRMLASDARRYRAALSLGARRAALFSFSAVRGADAENLHICADRFFVRDGVRYARTSRSLLIDCIEGTDVSFD